MLKAWSQYKDDLNSQQWICWQGVTNRIVLTGATNYNEVSLEWRTRMHPPTNGRIHREKCAPYLGKCGVKSQDRGALKKT